MDEKLWGTLDNQNEGKESVEAAEPAETEGQAEPADSAEMAAQTEQAEPAEPIETAGQTEPTEPAEPVLTDEAAKTAYEKPFIEMESEPKQEPVLEQAEDGSWRHAEESPYSPFYVPDRNQKKNNKLTIALVVVLLVLLAAGLIFAVSKLVEAAMGEVSTAWNEGAGAVEDFFADLEKNRQDNSSAEEYSYENPEEWEDFLKEYEEYDEYEYDDDYYEDDVYEPSPEDDFYVELADAVRDDLSYSVDFVDYEHYDAENNVYIWIQYVELSGDIPLIDQINEYLEEGAMYYAQQFDSMETSDLTLTAVSYVTYMDEETLSVVVDEGFSTDDYIQYDLYCMNFDLTTGTLLYNTEIIEASEELAEAFRDQSDYQNGKTTAVSQYSDKEIAEFMKDEDDLILYYTPVGLEIGYNHPEGWITATLKEYQQYLKKI